jgi:protein-S-isoprenylcysteine O-methyltransferase Ste14
MTAVRFFECFQLAALTSLVCLGVGRAIGLYARGIQVVVVDRERTAAQGLSDLVAIVAMLVWGYEIVASACPLSFHVVPQPLGTVLVDALAVKVIGAVTVLAGLLIHGLALRALADSWRLGIDRNAPGVLVTRGIYAWTRNPIYVALDLQVIGAFLVLGRLVFLVTALLIVVTLHEQIRREERFLFQRYGDAYRVYCARAGRYVTGF